MSELVAVLVGVVAGKNLPQLIGAKHYCLAIAVTTNGPHFDPHQAVIKLGEFKVFPNLLFHSLDVNQLICVYNLER